jgi:hypothetical protein
MQQQYSRTQWHWWVHWSCDNLYKTCLTCDMDSFFTIPGHNYQSTNSSIKTDFSVSDFERANGFFFTH